MVGARDFKAWLKNVHERFINPIKQGVFQGKTATHYKTVKKKKKTSTQTHESFSCHGNKIR